MIEINIRPENWVLIAFTLNFIFGTGAASCGKYVRIRLAYDFGLLLFCPPSCVPFPEEKLR
jgi:hypothetical protein